MFGNMLEKVVGEFKDHIDRLDQSMKELVSLLKENNNLQKQILNELKKK